MSFPNMLDLFQINENSLVTRLTSTGDFQPTYSDLVGLDFDISVLSTYNLGSVEKLEFNLFSFLPLDSMIELSSVKNDIDQLVKVFPSLEDEIELLDL
jgi:hypothetical protein